MDASVLQTPLPCSVITLIQTADFFCSTCKVLQIYPDVVSE